MCVRAPNLSGRTSRQPKHSCTHDLLLPSSNYQRVKVHTPSMSTLLTLLEVQWYEVMNLHSYRIWQYNILAVPNLQIDHEDYTSSRDLFFSCTLSRSPSVPGFPTSLWRPAGQSLLMPWSLLSCEVDCLAYTGQLLYRVSGVRLLLASD